MTRRGLRRARQRTSTIPALPPLVSARREFDTSTGETDALQHHWSRHPRNNSQNLHYAYIVTELRTGLLRGVLLNIPSGLNPVYGCDFFGPTANLPIHGRTFANKFFRLRLMYFLFVRCGFLARVRVFLRRTHGHTYVNSLN